ncbi:hypothetical protein [Streptomyces sp. NPDC086519]|uniref:hypothetical protein n=1 Tax=Streptomyces sp. NPDC086519 TaxID=3154863 RepID=UPI00343856EA
MTVDALTDVVGMRVGHATRTGDGGLTGTPVVPSPEGGAVAAVNVHGGGPGTKASDTADQASSHGLRRAQPCEGRSSHAGAPPLTGHQKAEDPGEHTSPGSSNFKINLTDNRCTDVPTAANCIGCELAKVRDSSSRGAALPFVARAVGLRTQ